MPRFNKVSIIIPVYNEKATLPGLLSAVEQSETNLEKEIILIDDGSTDGTQELIKNYKDKYKIVVFEKNQGKGAAVKAGFQISTGEIALIQDADREYDPNDYPRLLEPIIAGKADVVYGSRFLKNGLSEDNRIAYRHGYLFSRFLNGFSNFLTGQRLTDMYTCYKVFSRKAVDAITPKIRSARFGIDPELTALAAKNKFFFYEVPISYVGRTYEEGKKINWKDGLAAVWHIIRFNLF